VIPCTWMISDRSYYYSYESVFIVRAAGAHPQLAGSQLYAHRLPQCRLPESCGSA